MLKEWIYTGRVIAVALLKQAGDGASGVCRLAQQRGAAGACDDLTLFFPGCRALAAPALLFRMKRHGYSRCRADAAPAGVTLSCRR